MNPWHFFLNRPCPCPAELAATSPNRAGSQETVEGNNKPLLSEVTPRVLFTQHAKTGNEDEGQAENTCSRAPPALGTPSWTALSQSVLCTLGHTNTRGGGVFQTWARVARVSCRLACSDLLPRMREDGVPATSHSSAPPVLQLPGPFR